MARIEQESLWVAYKVKVVKFDSIDSRTLLIAFEWCDKIFYFCSFLCFNFVYD